MSIISRYVLIYLYIVDILKLYKFMYVYFIYKPKKVKNPEVLLMKK